MKKNKKNRKRRKIGKTYYEIYASQLGVKLALKIEIWFMPRADLTSDRAD